MFLNRVHLFEHLIIRRRSFALQSIGCDMEGACYTNHKTKLASFYRLCGDAFEFNTEMSRPKPKRAADFVKELLAVDNLDVSRDVETKEPPFFCRCCVRKLDRYKKSRNRNYSKIKFPRDKR